MKLKIFAFFGLVLSLFSWSTPNARAASTRPTYPTVIGVEGLGRASSASVFLDRMLDENFAAGVGFGGGPISIVPVYANYYLGGEQGSLYVTGGVSLVMNLSKVRQQESPGAGWKMTESVLPIFGAGYENRSDQGYLFRVTGYMAYADKKFEPWAGVSLGYAF
ncbi:MAG: hypothetical protein KGQ59_00225 [Bdellovibrionales bacterium]|nr:hypothetical protein [Bdellovibrionales bacterium]